MTESAAKITELSPVEDLVILAELERLAASCPWDKVEIWIRRDPDGELHFTTLVNSNEQFGWPSQWGHGITPQCAVNDVLHGCADRQSPEEQRQKKIEQLKDQIRKLEAVVIGEPPYIPNRQLAEYNASHQTVDV